MLTASRLGPRRRDVSDVPVELRFVDMLLIIIATLMFVAVLLSITSAFTASEHTNVAPRIMTSSAPAALAGQPYKLWLAAQGGDGSYTWRIAAGRLPTGLFLTPDGIVSGNPLRVESAQATIEVVDGQRRSYDKQLVFDVRPFGSRAAQEKTLPRVVSDTILLPKAVNGRPYRYDLVVNGGVPPYQWTLIKGRLPAGLYLSAQGNLTGQPQSSGTSTFTLRIADSGGSQITQHVDLIVQDGPRTIWQRVLGWVKTIATITGYIMILIWIAVFIFGRPAGVIDKLEPIWTRFGK